MRVLNWVMLLALATVGVSGCGKGADQVAGGGAGGAQKKDKTKKVLITVDVPASGSTVTKDDVTVNEVENLRHSHNKINFVVEEDNTLKCGYSAAITVAPAQPSVPLPTGCDVYQAFFSGSAAALQDRDAQKNVCAKYTIRLYSNKNCPEINIDPWAISKK